MSQRIASFVAVAPGVGKRTYADTVENQNHDSREDGHARQPCRSGQALAMVDSTATVAVD
jgi:hypothetical protein